MDASEYTNIRSFEDTHWWYVSTHRAVARELNVLAPQAKVLDAGCGTGGLLDILRERFDVKGFDASPEAVRAAAGRKYLSNRVKKGVIEDIPFEDGQFDAVTCIDVIYHQQVTSEHAALSEMRRVLKPGGYVVLQVPAFEFLRGGHDRVVHTRRRYTLPEVKSLLNDAGFDVVNIRFRYPWLFIPALIIRQCSRNSPGSDLQGVPPAVNTLLTHVSNFADARFFHFFPFGTSIFAMARRT